MNCLMLWHTWSDVYYSSVDFTQFYFQHIIINLLPSRTRVHGSRYTHWFLGSLPEVESRSFISSEGCFIVLVGCFWVGSGWPVFSFCKKEAYTHERAVQVWIFKIAIGRLQYEFERICDGSGEDPSCSRFAFSWSISSLLLNCVTDGMSSRKHLILSYRFNF